MRWVMLAAVVALVGCGEGSQPTRPSPPAREDWGPQQLAHYLGTKGVKVEGKTLSSRADHFIVMFLEPGTSVKEDSGDSAGVYVTMHLFKDSQQATEQANTMGEGAFHWGKFAIGLDQTVGPKHKAACLEYLARIEKALSTTPQN